MPGYVSDAVIRRLPRYYRHLRELEAEGVTQISSQELGSRMELTPSQIRQDINCFGGFGRQGYGYHVSDLKQHIGEILGLNQEHKMILIGMGNIGSAVANYKTFSREGFRVVASFDVDEEKLRAGMGDIPCHPMADLESYLAANPVDIAVIAVPAVAAQDILNRAEAAGIHAFWNFAPTDLTHADSTIVVNVHLSDTLQILSYKLAHPDNA